MHACMYNGIQCDIIGHVSGYVMEYLKECVMDWAYFKLDMAQNIVTQNSPQLNRALRFHPTAGVDACFSGPVSKYVYGLYVYRFKLRYGSNPL